MGVLVTGGAGFIGSHMVLELIDAGEDVLVLDNLSTGFRWAVPAEAKFVEGDIGDQNLVRRLLLRNKIDAIIHFAGSIVVPESVADPLGYYLNNTCKSRSLLAVAVEAKVPHFIFSSTAAVYGIAEAEAGRRGHRAQADIAIRQLEADDRDHAARRGGGASPPLCGAALFQRRRRRPQGRSGQSTPHATHLIKVASQAALGERPYLEVFGTDYPTPDGTCIRDYIHVSDLVRAHLAALELSAPGRQERGVELRLRRRLLGARGDRGGEARGQGTTSPSASAREGPATRPRSWLTPSRIRKVLGWEPKLNDLDTIVGHALGWEKRLRETRAA